MIAIIPIYKEELEKVFRYDAEKNVLERKLKKDGVWKVVNTSVANSGSGYVNVRFIDRLVRAHRLIFTLANGDIPENVQVDHIDNDKTNNNINNLQLLSHRDNNAKSCGGLKPFFRKDNQNYQVKEQVRFGGKKHAFNFGRFKLLAEAQAFCKAYRAQFGFGMPLWGVRKKTPEYWVECMQTFKDMYFNTQGEFSVTFKQVNLD